MVRNWEVQVKFVKPLVKTKKESASPLHFWVLHCPWHVCINLHNLTDLKRLVAHMCNYLKYNFTSVSAWIGSVAGSLNFLGGPAASFLCNRYGCRPVAFIGGLLAILGLFLTSFVQETAKMYVTYGLLWGIGSSFSFIPSVVVLGQYFHRRFPLANGIASSGSGIGGLLAAPFINFILSSVGWQNSMRILACFAVLLLLSASVYRPVKRQVILRGETNVRASEAVSSVPSVWRCKSYIVLVVAVALFQFCYPVPFMHLVSTAYLFSSFYL